MTEQHQEMFESSGDQQCLARPAEESASISARDMQWQSCGTDGFWIKPLFEDSNTSQRTWLMKVDAGAWSPAHAHTELEQIYVLEGTFYDEEKNYAAGDYIIRAPGAMHTAGSRDGALVMLVYSAGEV